MNHAAHRYFRFGLRVFGYSAGVSSCARAEFSELGFGHGLDSNACTRAAPCSSFSGAFAKTNAGGEINCIDAGDFGTVNIIKSITIDCTGTFVGMQTGVTGLTVNGAGIIVTLRGLAINGTGISAVGVHYQQGARLNIEDCTIYNFLSATPNGNGIIINNTSGAAKMHVSNTVIRNNSTAVSGAGIRLSPTGTGSANVTLKNVQITGNFRGIDVNSTGSTAGSNVVVSGGAITHNAENAINVDTNANIVQVMIEGVMISNNLRGVITNGAGANTRIGSSIISQNGTAVGANGGGTLQSYRNNQIEFNGNNNTPIAQATLQ
jgi:hypothetical protein